MNVPNSVINYATRDLRAGVYFIPPYLELFKIQEDLREIGWRFYVVDATRGYCKPRDRMITIPLWAVQRATNLKGKHRLIQYILHEIAHALDVMENRKLSGHKKPFMDILIRICPKELLIYEMTYKPKNLVAAGAIFCPDSLEF